MHKKELIWTPNNWKNSSIMNSLREIYCASLQNEYIAKSYPQLNLIVNAPSVAILDYWNFTTIFFFSCVYSLFSSGGCDTCVYSLRETGPNLQEIDSHEAEMISPPIRVPPSLRHITLYRLDNTHWDWLPFLTRASIIEFSEWIEVRTANNNLPNPMALIIHKVAMWWNKLDNKRSVSYYICFQSKIVVL